MPRNVTHLKWNWISWLSRDVYANVWEKKPGCFRMRNLSSCIDWNVVELNCLEEFEFVFAHHFTLPIPMTNGKTKILAISVVCGWLFSSGQFPLSDAPAGNHGNCIHHPGPSIRLNQYNYHDSLQAHLIQGIGHFVHVQLTLLNRRNLLVYQCWLCSVLHTTVEQDCVLLVCSAILLRPFQRSQWEAVYLCQAFQQASLGY